MLGFRTVRRARAIALTVLIGGLLAPLLDGPVEARFPGPKTANIYIRNYYEPGDAELLSRYDLLILDADTPASVVEAIRSYGTGTKILAFIPANGTYEAAMQFPDGSIWREMYEAAETHGWWLKDTQGGHINDHGAKFTTNITTVCPPNNAGQTILDWFPKWVVNTLLVNNPTDWDGVFLDDCWVGIFWISYNTQLNPYPIDADENGIADTQTELDGWYKAGTDTLVTRIRRLLPPDMLVMGNGQNHFYSMNGAMIENFPFTSYADAGCPYNYSWTWDMFGDYGYASSNQNYTPTPGLYNMINSKWIWGDRYAPVGSSDFEKFKDFTLASSMMRDGYYSLDWYDLPNTKKSHNSIWWEPEYDIPFGAAIGPAYQLTRNGVTVWRRDFDGGSIVLNPNATQFGPSLPDSLPLVRGWEAALIRNGQFYFPDLTPPARVSDLAVINAWSDSVELQWTNAGDDDFQGTAASLVIRRTPNGPLTDANFTTGVRLQPPVTPESGGSIQRAIVRGLVLGTQYWFALRHVDESGNGSLVSNNPSITAGGGLSGVPVPVPARWGLETPSPNPFVGSMVVGVLSPDAGEMVRVSLLDAAGRQVRVLLDGPHPGGRLELAWDGRDAAGRMAPAGVYFLVLTNGPRTDVRKIVRAR
ncbi:MAG: putative glycoside hydrolase [Candidatus Eisenbacteria bacterium]|nr:putative glycoside hydrolase [Candidatus Eisenbacteria bacterium]